MKKSISIGASLACANYKNLENDIRELEEAGVDYIHFDVMDGHFVQNFCLNIDILKMTRELTSLPIDVHLMVDNPENYISAFANEHCNLISIHAEVTRYIQHELVRIRELGLKAGIALNPATPLSILEHILPDLDFILIMTVNPGFTGQKLIPAMITKIQELQQLLTDNESIANIEVDGNVSFDNIPRLISAGATMLVGGTSSIFMEEIGITEAVKKVKEVISLQTEPRIS
jgi:ribulose-phosphate 3-epimerase